MDSTFWVLLSGVVVATAGLGAAYKQLRHLSKQLELADQSNRANVLMNLDKRYEDILGSRIALQDLEQEAREKAKESRNEEEAFLNEMSNSLATIRTTQQQKYLLVKQVFDFCETVGFLMERHYVYPKDVNDLWGPSIRDWACWCRLHITSRQQIEAREIYKYFLLAAEQCKD